MLLIHQILMRITTNIDVIENIKKSLGVEFMRAKQIMAHGHNPPHCKIQPKYRYLVDFIVFTIIHPTPLLSRI